LRRTLIARSSVCSGSASEVQAERDCDRCCRDLAEARQAPVRAGAPQTREDALGESFVVRVVDESTTDPSQDGMVTAQDPSGGTDAPKGSTVVLTVARLS
jgi:PASTA domain